MYTHFSQLRAHAASLLHTPAAVCCPFAQRAMASNGHQWVSQQSKGHGFHTAVAAAKRSSDSYQSLNWLALIRTRLHQDSSCSTNLQTRKVTGSARHIPCCRSFAATSPFLPVLIPAMRHVQTAPSPATISPSSSGDSLASMADSTDGSTPVASTEARAADEWKLEYTGSLSKTIRTLKACTHRIHEFPGIHHAASNISCRIDSFNLFCRS
jgi:hypothetical protein